MNGPVQRLIEVRQDPSLPLKSLLNKIAPEGIGYRRLEEVKQLVLAYRNSSAVVKVGGSALSEQCGEMVFENMKILRDLGIPLVLVHGGGREIDDEMNRRQMKIERINGQRVSDDATVTVLKEVMTRIGIDIMNSLINADIDAVNILGHGGILRVEQISKDLKHVGRVVEVKKQGILGHLKDGITPVITPLGCTPDQVYNINADLASSGIAGALESKKIVFVTNVDGIFDGRSWRKEISVGEIRDLISNGTISYGMIPKAEAVIHAVGTFKVSASVINGKKDNSLLSHLFGFNGAGTEIVE